MITIGVPPFAGVLFSTLRRVRNCLSMLNICSVAGSRLYVLIHPEQIRGVVLVLNFDQAIVIVSRDS